MGTTKVLSLKEAASCEVSPGTLGQGGKRQHLIGPRGGQAVWGLEGAGGVE